MPDLSLIEPSQEDSLIERALVSHAATGRPMDILEAGCGPSSPLTRNIDYRLTGLEVDPAVLEGRKNEKKDLHEDLLRDPTIVAISTERASTASTAHLSSSTSPKPSPTSTDFDYPCT